MQSTQSDVQGIIDKTQEWLEKAVIGLNLCPFAKAPYANNQVRIFVSRAKHLDGFLEDLDAEIQRLLNTDAQELETTLFVDAGLFGDFLLFNDMLDLAEQALADNAAEGVIQIAPFHPQFQFADTEAEDISNYTNRSPYPTLHLIREERISQAVEAFPNTAAIFERNIRLLKEMGHEGWSKLGLSNGSMNDDLPANQKDRP